MRTRVRAVCMGHGRRCMLVTQRRKCVLIMSAAAPVALPPMSHKKSVTNSRSMDSWERVSWCVAVPLTQAVGVAERTGPTRAGRGQSEAAPAPWESLDKARGLVIAYTHTAVRLIIRL